MRSLFIALCAPLLPAGLACSLCAAALAYAPEPIAQPVAQASSKAKLSGAAVAAQSAQDHPAGSHFKDCDSCPEMVSIPGGEFTMGSTGSEAMRQDDEGPRHRVSVKPFAAGRYAVTFAQWDDCVSAGGCRGYWPDDNAWGRGNRPVIHVSWNDAQAYAKWLSDKTGQNYRLLSEAEWEYAARAGTTTPFYTGPCINASQANYDGTGEGYTGCAAQTGVFRKQTTPVGMFDANGFGLYDMAGNVWQWVEDAYHESYAGAPQDGSAWGPDGARHVLRGGSWSNDARNLRSAARLRYRPGNRIVNVGFRIARTL